MAGNEIICNLLDASVEPTDAQLARLMHLVGDAARERKVAAQARLRETIERQTAEVRARFNARARLAS